MPKYIFSCMLSVPINPSGYENVGNFDNLHDAFKALKMLDEFVDMSRREYSSSVVPCCIDFTSGTTSYISVQRIGEDTHELDELCNALIKK